MSVELKRICIFCGANTGKNPAYAAAARALGAMFAERGIGLVYGAGNVGMMGVAADAALAGGGEVIGVIPRLLVEKEVAHTGLTRIEVVETMHERKRLMYELSDAFIALPGGMGTLDELFETLTWIQLGLHAKPCGLLNVDGYYDPLLTMLDRATGEGFIGEAQRGILAEAGTTGDLLGRLAEFEDPGMRTWIREEDL